MTSKSKSILLADDDEDDRLFFEEALDQLSHNMNFQSVNNGLEVLHFLNCNSENLPTVLFLDLNMPVLDGHSCLKEIRSHVRYNDIIIIIYSTSYNPNTAEKLRIDGANYYMRKPSNFNDIKNDISKTLDMIEKDAYRFNNKNKYLINI